MTSGHSTRAATGPGRHNLAAHRAIVRSRQRVDYRLRSLDFEPSQPVPTMATRTDGQAHRRRRRLPRLAYGAFLLAVAALGALLIQGYVVQPFSVPGNAMTPTFKASDRILVDKSGVLGGPIQHGDIVVFRPQQRLSCTVLTGQGGDLLLRVVALPGETIWSVDNAIFVNGRPLSDQRWYDPRFGQLGSTPIVSTTLGPDQYFVLADNRSYACDSRVFGPVDASSIVGQGVAIVGRYGHVFFRTL